MDMFSNNNRVSQENDHGLLYVDRGEDYTEQQRQSYNSLVNIQGGDMQQMQAEKKEIEPIIDLHDALVIEPTT